MYECVYVLVLYCIIVLFYYTCEALRTYMELRHKTPFFILDLIHIPHPSATV